MAHQDSYRRDSVPSSKEGGSEQQKVRDILQRAGVAQDVIDSLAPIMTVEYAKRSAQLLAQQNPAGGMSQYSEALTSYGFSAKPETRYFSGGADRAFLQHGVGADKPYVTNKSGALHYPDLHVIADVGQAKVYFQENREQTPGSSAWLAKIQESWSPQKINEWRKRLASYGYDVAGKGPMDQVLLATLREYHTARYLNRGKAIPLDASVAGKQGEDRIFDPAEVRNAVRQQFRTTIGDDPSDAELESWSTFIKQTARRLANKKGYTPETAAVSAEERFIERFETNPKIKFLQESEEERTDLRDSLLGTIQAINSVAG